MAAAVTPVWAVDPFFTVTFGPENSTEATGVRGAATFSFTGTGNAVDMTITLSNLTGTTPPPLASQPTASEFVALAFQLPSNISTVDLGAGANADLGYTPSSGSLFDIAVADADFSPFDSTAPSPPPGPVLPVHHGGERQGLQRRWQPRQRPQQRDAGLLGGHLPAVGR